MLTDLICFYLLFVGLIISVLVSIWVGMSFQANRFDYVWCVRLCPAHALVASSLGAQPMYAAAWLHVPAGRSCSSGCSQKCEWWLQPSSLSAEPHARPASAPFAASTCVRMPHGPVPGSSCGILHLSLPVPALLTRGLEACG
jgi:hypothetical protein